MSPKAEIQRLKMEKNIKDKTLPLAHTRYIRLLLPRNSPNKKLSI